MQQQQQQKHHQYEQGPTSTSGRGSRRRHVDSTLHGSGGHEATRNHGQQYGHGSGSSGASAGNGSSAGGSVQYQQGERRRHGLNRSRRTSGGTTSTTGAANGSRGGGGHKRQGLAMRGRDGGSGGGASGANGASGGSGSASGGGASDGSAGSKKAGDVARVGGRTGVAPGPTSDGEGHSGTGAAASMASNQPTTHDGGQQASEAAAAGFVIVDQHGQTDASLQAVQADSDRVHPTDTSSTGMAADPGQWQQVPYGWPAQSADSAFYQQLGVGMVPPGMVAPGMMPPGMVPPGMMAYGANVPYGMPVDAVGGGSQMAPTTVSDQGAKQHQHAHPQQDQEEQQQQQQQQQQLQQASSAYGVAGRDAAGAVAQHDGNKGVEGAVAGLGRGEAVGGALPGSTALGVATGMPAGYRGAAAAAAAAATAGVPIFPPQQMAPGMNVPGPITANGTPGDGGGTSAASSFNPGGGGGPRAAPDAVGVQGASMLPAMLGFRGVQSVPMMGYPPWSLPPWSQQVAGGVQMQDGVGGNVDSREQQQQQQQQQQQEQQFQQQFEQQQQVQQQQQQRGGYAHGFAKNQQAAGTGVTRAFESPSDTPSEPQYQVLLQHAAGHPGLMGLVPYGPPSGGIGPGYASGEAAMPTMQTGAVGFQQGPPPCNVNEEHASGGGVMPNRGNVPVASVLPGAPSGPSTGHVLWHLSIDGQLHSFASITRGSVALLRKIQKDKMAVISMQCGPEWSPATITNDAVRVDVFLTQFVDAGYLNHSVHDQLGRMSYLAREHQPLSQKQQRRDHGEGQAQQQRGSKGRKGSGASGSGTESGGAAATDSASGKGGGKNKGDGWRQKGWSGEGGTSSSGGSSRQWAKGGVSADEQQQQQPGQSGGAVGGAPAGDQGKQSKGKGAKGKASQESARKGDKLEKERAAQESEAQAKLVSQLKKEKQDMASQIVDLQKERQVMVKHLEGVMREFRQAQLKEKEAALSLKEKEAELTRRTREAMDLKKKFTEEEDALTKREQAVEAEEARLEQMRVAQERQAEKAHAALREATQVQRQLTLQLEQEKNDRKAHVVIAAGAQGARGTTTNKRGKHVNTAERGTAVMGRDEANANASGGGEGGMGVGGHGTGVSAHVGAGKPSCNMQRQPKEAAVQGASSEPVRATVAASAREAKSGWEKGPRLTAAFSTGDAASGQKKQGHDKGEDFGLMAVLASTTDSGPKEVAMVDDTPSKAGPVGHRILNLDDVIPLGADASGASGTQAVVDQYVPSGAWGSGAKKVGESTMDTDAACMAALLREAGPDTASGTGVDERGADEVTPGDIIVMESQGSKKRKKKKKKKGMVVDDDGVVALLASVGEAVVTPSAMAQPAVQLEAAAVKTSGNQEGDQRDDGLPHGRGQQQPRDHIITVGSEFRSGIVRGSSKVVESMTTGTKYRIQMDVYQWSVKTLTTECSVDGDMVDAFVAELVAAGAW